MPSLGEVAKMLLVLRSWLEARPGVAREAHSPRWPLADSDEAIGICKACCANGARSGAQLTAHRATHYAIAPTLDIQFDSNQVIDP
jgi:hypothetical protein